MSNKSFQSEALFNFIPSGVRGGMWYKRRNYVYDNNIDIKNISIEKMSLSLKILIVVIINIIIPPKKLSFEKK